MKAVAVADYKQATDVAIARIEDSLKRGGKSYTTYCAVSDGLIMLLGLRTGYRVGDLLKCTRKNIINKNTIDQRGRLTEAPHLALIEGKTKKYREIPLEKFLHDYIVEQGRLLAQQPGVDVKEIDNLPIFYNPKTEKHFTEMWVHKRLGLLMPKRINGNRNISAHSLRKAFALRIYEHTGKDINRVRSLLNHSSAKVTQAYLNIPDEAQSSIVLAAVNV